MSAVKFTSRHLELDELARHAWEREREEGGGGWRTLKGGGKGFWIWIWEGELTRVSWLKPQTAPWRGRHACQQNTAPNTLSLALTRMIHSSLPHSHACSCHLCWFLFWCWIFILVLSSDPCASYLLHGLSNLSESRSTCLMFFAPWYVPVHQRWAPASCFVSMSISLHY